MKITAYDALVANLHTWHDYFISREEPLTEKFFLQWAKDVAQMAYTFYKCQMISHEEYDALISLAGDIEEELF